MEYELMQLNLKMRGKLSVNDKIRLDATVKYKQSVVSKLIDKCAQIIEITSDKTPDGLVARNHDPQVKVRGCHVIWQFSIEI